MRPSRLPHATACPEGDSGRPPWRYFPLSRLRTSKRCRGEITALPMCNRGSTVSRLKTWTQALEPQGCHPTGLERPSVVQTGLGPELAHAFLQHSRTWPQGHHEFCWKCFLPQRAHCLKGSYINSTTLVAFAKDPAACLRKHSLPALLRTPAQPGPTHHTRYRCHHCATGRNGRSLDATPADRQRQIPGAPPIIQSATSMEALRPLRSPPIASLRITAERPS